jgi:hypothetical protein
MDGMFYSASDPCRKRRPPCTDSRRGAKDVTVTAVTGDCRL